MSGESDDQHEEMMAEASTTTQTPAEPIVGIQNEINMQDIVDNTEMLEAGATPVALNAPVSEAPDESHETFNITHRSAIDGSIINPATTQPTPIGGFSPVQPTVNAVNTCIRARLGSTSIPHWYREVIGQACSFGVSSSQLAFD